MSKIKAINPKIIVNRDVDRPYYSIEYYDTSDNQWHIGYSSYELKNVVEWLDTDFDVIKADVEPVHHGHWKKSKGNERPTENGFVHDDRYVCDCCGWGCCCETKLDFSFCPNCGAKNGRG